VSAGRGIVVLPAIAGINDYIRRVEKRFGTLGWDTECIDYHEGTAPDLSSPPRILEAVAKLDDERVLAMTTEAVTRLQKRGATAVAAIGYCVGGGYALLAGAAVDGLCAVANYYGGLRQTASPLKPAAPLDKAGALRVPMISHYGNADRFVPSAHVDALESALDAAGKTFELFRYAGAPHAFDEDFRSSYRPVAAHEAWGRTQVFLDWYAKGGVKV
jgi:carboxymethylenebutenolidase